MQIRSILVPITLTLSLAISSSFGAFLSSVVIPSKAFAVPPTSTTSINVCYSSASTYFWGFGGNGYIRLRDKLDAAANFGAGGTHPTDINLIPVGGVITAAALDAANCNIYASASELNNTAAEAAAILAWAQNCNGYIVNMTWSGTHDKLLPALGTSSLVEFLSPSQAYNFAAAASTIQTNVFGTLANPLNDSPYNYFRLNNVGAATVLSTRTSGEPNIVEFDNPNMLVTTNMVRFGDSWGMSAGTGITTTSDIMAMNMFAHAIDNINKTCLSSVTTVKQVRAIFRDGTSIGAAGPVQAGDDVCYEIAYNGTGTVYDVSVPTQLGFIPPGAYPTTTPDAGPYLQDLDLDTINENIVEYNVAGAGTIRACFTVL